MVPAPWALFLRPRPAVHAIGRASRGASRGACVDNARTRAVRRGAWDGPRISRRRETGATADADLGAGSAADADHKNSQLGRAPPGFFSMSERASSDQSRPYSRPAASELARQLAPGSVRARPRGSSTRALSAASWEPALADAGRCWPMLDRTLNVDTPSHARVLSIHTGESPPFLPFGETDD